MNSHQWIRNAYATYDSDKRTNWPEDMESFIDAVLKNVPNHIGQHLTTDNITSSDYIIIP